MKLKILLGILSLTTYLSFSTPVVLADPLPPPLPPTTIGLISHYSALYGVSRSTVYNLLNCESHLNPGAIGDLGTSFGIAQIHLPAHPDITEAQALDARWSIEWTVAEIAAGKISMWSCARILGYWSPTM